MHAHLCNGAEASLPWKLLRTYLESCTSIVQAFRLPSALLPARRNQSPDAVRSRNLSKSTIAHDAVAAAVLYKHHPIIRVGAGLIQFVYWSHLRLVTEATRNRNAFLPLFRAILKLSLRVEFWLTTDIGYPKNNLKGDNIFTLVLFFRHNPNFVLILFFRNNPNFHKKMEDVPGNILSYSNIQTSLHFLLSWLANTNT